MKQYFSKGYLFLMVWDIVSEYEMMSKLYNKKYDTKSFALINININFRNRTKIFKLY